MTLFTLSFLRWVYFWPVPTNMTGWPVLYDIESVAPTCAELLGSYWGVIGVRGYWDEGVKGDSSRGHVTGCASWLRIRSGV